MADRRSTLRFEIVGRLRGTLAVEEAVCVHDVSPGGALIEVPWAPPLDTRYTVRLASDHHLTSVGAQVRHVRQALTGTRCLVGLQFIPSTTDPGLIEIERLLAPRQAAKGDVQSV